MDLQTFMQNARQLQARYTPSDEVKQHLAQLDLIAVVGPTSAGKTTIMEKSEVPYVLSDVTRRPRKHERDGVDYNFRTDYEQLWGELERGEFVQYVLSETGFYGTKDAAYPASGPCTMAIYANAIDYFKSMGFKNCRPVYILPPNYHEWMRRAGILQGDEIDIRLREAKQSIEFALSDSSYIFIVNDDLLRATEDFEAIANGKMPDAASQERAREVGLELLAKIET